jgi:hypothetical protein
MEHKIADYHCGSVCSMDANFACFSNSDAGRWGRKLFSLNYKPDLGLFIFEIQSVPWHPANWIGYAAERNYMLT